MMNFKGLFLTLQLKKRRHNGDCTRNQEYDCKMCQWICDDMTVAPFLSRTKTYCASHTEMIENPVVKFQKPFKAHACYILGPISGELACNMYSGQSGLNSKEAIDMRSYKPSQWSIRKHTR